MRWTNQKGRRPTPHRKTASPSEDSSPSRKHYTVSPRRHEGIRGLWHRQKRSLSHAIQAKEDRAHASGSMP